MATTGCRGLVEFGSGSASKTRVLLDAMSEAHGRGTIPYVPLDVSESVLTESARRLQEEYAGRLEVSGFVGDFDDGGAGGLLRSLPPNGDRLAIFLGGTIGNFTRKKRADFLAEVGSGLSDGDHLLVGMDLIKDTSTLEAAYNDAAGVTARFNKNMLKVNDHLAGDFDLKLFGHRAIYNTEDSHVEMWLHSATEQEVRLGEIDFAAPFHEGEGMRTETSAKFTHASVERMFGDSGLKLIEFYTDERSLFGLALGHRTRCTPK